MRIERVNALVCSRQSPDHEDFKLQVYRTGPDAISVTEVAILQAINGLDSVRMISHAGEYEIEKQREFDRLRGKYPKTFMLVYPSAAVPMPKTIADLELSPDQLDNRPPRTLTEEDDVPGPVARGATLALESAESDGDPREAIKKRLREEFGVQLGFGNYGLPRLQGMLQTEIAKKGKAA